MRRHPARTHRGVKWTSTTAPKTRRFARSSAPGSKRTANSPFLPASRWPTKPTAIGTRASDGIANSTRADGSVLAGPKSTAAAAPRCSRASSMSRRLSAPAHAVPCHRLRHLAGRSHAHPLGHRGTEAPPRAQNSHRRRNLVPGLLGAQLGLGPRLGADPRGRGRRLLRRQRSESLDLLRASRRHGFFCSSAPIPTRPSTRASATCWST